MNRSPSLGSSSTYDGYQRYPGGLRYDPKIQKGKTYLVASIANSKVADVASSITELINYRVS